MEKIFSLRLRHYLGELHNRWDGVQEVRLRSGKPLIVVMNGKEWMIHRSGRLSQDGGDALCVQSEDIQEMMAYICKYSLYAFEDKLRQGFITIQGGHRIGIAGQVSIDDGKVKSMAYVSSLNIRVAHSIKGCGNKIFPFLWENGRGCHTVIISPPGCGKTTLLRDLIRLFSDGYCGYQGMSVGLVDERSEVGACYMGVPQNDIGMRTDVLDNCPKHIGIEMMVRSMAPKLIAFDELGGTKDVDAVLHAINCGCRVLTTLHGEKISDVVQKCGSMIFERYIVLNDWSHADRISKVLDYNGKIMFEAV